MDNILLFDIDGTLFNPEKFGKLIRAEFTQILNINEEELIRANADYYANLESTSDFNPHEIAAFMAKRYGIGQDALDRVFWGEDKIYKESFYEDAEPAIKKLSQSKTLGIFSQGLLELQMRKLEAVGIKKYFKDEYIFIHARKLSDDAVAVLPRGATVVDDNHDVAVKLASFVNSIWMNRRTEDSDQNVRTIHTLSELIP